MGSIENIGQNDENRPSAEAPMRFVISPLRSVRPGVLGGLLGGGVFIALWALAVAFPQYHQLQRFAMGATAIGGAGLVMLGLGLWGLTKARYPTPVRYVVDRETIARGAHGGPMSAGQWQDLVEVRLTTPQLIFDNGKSMPIDDLFWPTPQWRLLHRISTLSGSDSLLTYALSDYGCPQRIPVAVLTASVFAWLLAGLGIYVHLRSSYPKSLELLLYSGGTGLMISGICLFVLLLCQDRACLRKREHSGKYRRSRSTEKP